MTALLAEVIATERLTLVPLRVEHAQEMAVVLSDPALHTFIGGAPATAEELRTRYARMVAGSPDPDVSWCNWVIGVREDQRDGAGERERGGERLAGTVQATVSLDPEDHEDPEDHRGHEDPGRHGDLVAEIAWVVGTPWQGRGIATEAARALVRWLDEQGVRTLIAHVHPDHGASAAVAAAVGLTPTDVWHDGEVRWRRPLGR
ncbi:GNAT family N-acetyltransferase [Streptomyces sp. NPDC058220]|uniref:GNAT family N-acetyltransferase n=1 Tax=Streptomyces sp. NPDC058220 TaxID=3346387 RepID=UPI0036E5D8C0